MQASRASDQASGTRPSPADLKSKIDDLIAGEVSSGKADQRSGHRTAEHLQGGLRQRSRRGWWSRRSARRRRPASGRPAAFGRCVLQRGDILVFLVLDIDRRHPEAVPAIVAGVTVGLVIDVLRRDRHDFE
jgi:hypothetical protein